MDLVMNPAFLPLGLLIFALFYSALSDATSLRISNRLVLTILAAFVMLTPFAWAGPAVFGLHMLVGLVFLFLGFGLFAVGGFGGGDAKIMAVIALFFTPVEAFQFVVYTSLFGGVLAVFVMKLRTHMPAFATPNGFGYGLFNDQTKIPYGIAIAASALVILPTSDIVVRALG